MKWINGYLMFDGKCGEAMKFYERCFGGDLTLVPYGADQIQGLAPGETRIMHARLTQGGGLLMASDIHPGVPFVQGNSVWLAIECDSAKEQDEMFEALSVGATVTMPLQEQFWGSVRHADRCLRDSLDVQSGVEERRSLDEVVAASWKRIRRLCCGGFRWERW